MLYVSRWKTIAVVLACLVSLLFSLPNFFSKTTVQRWPAWLPRMQLPLGLDLSGGAHLLLAMETAMSARTGSRACGKTRAGGSARPRLP